MVMVSVFVEGAGQGNKDLDAAYRRAFGALSKRLGLSGKQPRFFICGNGRSAYDQFVAAWKQGDPGVRYFLLVDSESPVADASKPWLHLSSRRDCPLPDGAESEQCHLMTQAIEAWLVADRAALAQHYGKNFDEKPLPPVREAESRAASELVECLKRASKKTAAGGYRKGHAPAILALLNPTTVEQHCHWAKRFFDSLKAAAQ